MNINIKKKNNKIKISFLEKIGKDKFKWLYEFFNKNIFIIRNNNILKNKYMVGKFIESVLTKWNFFIQIVIIKKLWREKNNERRKKISNYTLYKKSFYVKKKRFFINYFIFWLFQYLDQLTKVPLQEYSLLWSRTFFAFVTIVSTKWYLREYFLVEILEYDKYFKFNFANVMPSSTRFIFNNRLFSTLKLFSKVKKIRENFNFSYYKTRGPISLSKISSFFNTWMRADAYIKIKFFNKIKEEIVKEKNEKNYFNVMELSPLIKPKEISLENKIYFRRKGISRYAGIGSNLQKRSKFFIDYKTFLQILILKKRIKKEWKAKKLRKNLEVAEKRYTQFKTSKKRYEEVYGDKEEINEFEEYNEYDKYLKILNKNEREADPYYFNPDHPYTFDDFLIEEIMEDKKKNEEDRKQEEEELKEKEKEKEKKQEKEDQKKKEREEGEKQQKEEEKEREKQRKEEERRREEKEKKREEKERRREEEEKKREEEEKKREEEEMKKDKKKWRKIKRKRRKKIKKKKKG